MYYILGGMIMNKEIVKTLGTVAGNVIGGATGIKLISMVGSVTGLSAAGISSGLATIGGIMGSGMIAGVIATGGIMVVAGKLGGIIAYHIIK